MMIVSQRLFVFAGCLLTLLLWHEPSVGSGSRLFKEADWFQASDTVRRDTTRRRLPIIPYAQDRFGDPFSNPFTPSPLFMRPPRLKTNVELDSSGRFFRVDEKIDGIDYRPPSYLPYDYLRDYRFRQDMRNYWKSLSLSQDGQNEVSGRAADQVIPPIKLGPAAYRLFGGNTVDIRTNGNLILDFGGLWQRVDNPQIPVRQQRNGGFNFDQQIAMNLAGKIGEKVDIAANFDTKSAFQFEQRYRVSYTAFEEDIIQSVQVGNVSFPVSNSLITGGQNLFGINTRMRFGKLWVNTVVSSQRGSTEQLVIKNGAQARQFQVRSDAYDVNRHFFLAHFFRDNFERALRNLPAIATSAFVTRVEVYITNRNNNTQTLRNLVGLMDLGEGRPHKPSNPFIGEGTPGPARNDANRLFANLRNGTRVADDISNQLENQFRLVNGEDYEVLRGARRLEEREFTINKQLGFISLLTPLRNDEVLLVSFEYTVNGQTYKVGELTEDYANLPIDQVIFMKMLTPTTIRTDLPMWDLMMKNIYALQATQLRRENFQLRIIYRDDLTGIDNPSLHEGVRTTNVPLVQLLGLDRLNPNNDPPADGNFDYIEGITIDPQFGRIMFPVLEPFGSHLAAQFLPEEAQLRNKYVFQDLYTGTQADALLNTQKNKFFMMGSYQSALGNEIMLPGINIARNSVVVRAGNTMLVEGTDFTVDYQFGRVRILNDGVMNSGREIRIQYERADMFSFQTRNLAGVDLEYRLTNNIRFHSTLMHLNERPLITRVSVGNEPVRNTLWGFGADYRSKSRLLTRLVDALPLVSTKEESSITVKSEFAQMLPGNPRLLGQSGTSYLDDFEGAEVPYDLTRTPTTWVLGTTPELIRQKHFNPAEPLSFNYNRARLAWYNIDNVFYFAGGGALRSRPSNITPEDLQNHYVRLLPFNEVFQNKQREQVNFNEISFDMAYFPSERGPYNYNTNLRPDGKLANNPEENFGAITRAITSDIDFDNINIQYVEFWLMDPFIRTRNGQIEGENNSTGGELYLNLGNISEDIIPDKRHFFENGLTQQPEGMFETDFGRVPTQQFLTNAFSAEAGARAWQDVGFDGLSDAAEREKYASFFNALPPTLSPEARQEIEQDPSGDNFRYYLGDELDARNFGILARYKKFNGNEGNSPEIGGGQAFPASSSNFPDNEDLNRDNTLSDLNQYYEYKVDINPGSLNVNNRFIVSKVTATAPESGELVDWYQFRIPLRGPHARRVGGIDGFKSIRFMRLFLTGWRQPVVLRMVNFQMVGAQWRPFLGNLTEPGLNKPEEPYDPIFTVQSINIEQNGRFDGENTPYTLPPGFGRDYDITSTVTRQLNEQSIKLCVEGLRDRDARAVFKNLVADLVNYERIKMELHAESRVTPSGQVTAFLRLGTDFTDNYYEIEVPLTMTPIPSTDPEIIWPRENQIDIAIRDLIRVKAERDRAGVSLLMPYPAATEPNVGRYRVTVVGRPDISSVQTAMIGIRNPESNDRLPHSVCIWANELRVTGFDRTPGYAVNTAVNMQLADLATVSGSFRYSTVGFGSIQDKVSDRSRSVNSEFDISSNISLDRFYLHKLGFSIPLFVGYQRRTSTPYFNPLDPDMPLEIALETFQTDEQRDFYRKLVRDFFEARSVNLSNVRKKKMKQDAKPHPWDIENLSFSASYSDSYLRNANTDALEQQQWRTGAAYAYSSQAKPIEPFKDLKWLKSPYLALIRDFNFNLIPNSVSIRGDLDRRYIRTQFRNRDLTTDGLLPTFEKSFFFNRAYNMQWNLTKSIGIEYAAVANAIIDEPDGALDTDVKRDSVLFNLRNFGRMKQFSQDIGVNYRLPLDKIPFADWINLDARYAAQFGWMASPVSLQDSIGNILNNANTRALQGRVDLGKLYNKVPFLKRLNQQAEPSRSRNRNQQAANPDDPLELKKQRIEVRLGNINRKIDKRKEQQEKKRQRELEKLAEQLARQAARDSLTADSIRQLTPISADSPPLIAGEDTTKKSRLERRKFRTEDQLAALQKEINRRRSENIRPAEQKVLKGVLRTAMLVKDLNFSYSENNSTTLPGFLPTPYLFGLDQSWQAPGLPFVLGSQDPSIRERAAMNDWLARSELQNNPFQQVTNRQLSVRTTVEPFKDFKVDFEAKKNEMASYSEVFRYLPDQGIFDVQTPVRTGSFGMSYFTLRTAFDANDAQNRSRVFDTFVANRSVIKNRLDALNPNGEYEINAQDVLISSFVAAYSGRDPLQQRLSAFPIVPLPNWRFSYSGLSNIPQLKEMFKSVTITHAYSSNYQIGSYTSSLLYGASSISLGVGVNDVQFPVTDDEGRLVPVFVVNQLMIQEVFSPLIGVNMRTQNNVQIKVDYKRARDMALNLSNAQVAEQRTSDITLDVGYTKAGLKVPFRIQGVQHVLKNDLTFRMALTMRDTRTIQRKIEDDPVVTAGNVNIQLRPTVSYMVDRRTTLQLYFDRSINDPLISNSFRRTNTSFGVQLRYGLNQ